MVRLDLTCYSIAMAEQLIADGRYKLQFATGHGTLTAAPGAPMVLLEDTGGDETKWDVASTSDGSYNLRNVRSGAYLGDDDADPASMAPMLKGTSASFAWKIERGPEEGLFFLSPARSDGATRLSMSILRVFPPHVGWMPSGGPDQLWRLTKV